METLKQTIKNLEAQLKEAQDNNKKTIAENKSLIKVKDAALSAMPDMGEGASKEHLIDAIEAMDP